MNSIRSTFLLQSVSLTYGKYYLGDLSSLVERDVHFPFPVTSFHGIHYGGRRSRKPAPCLRRFFWGTLQSFKSLTTCQCPTAKILRIFLQLANTYDVSVSSNNNLPKFVFYIRPRLCDPKASAWKYSDWCPLRENPDPLFMAVLILRHPARGPKCSSLYLERYLVGRQPFYSSVVDGVPSARYDAALFIYIS